MTLPFVPYQIPGVPGRIAIVGEAPGAEEARQGKPFVGRSGQLLDKNLALAGIARDACLVANVFRMQPPKNKVAHFFLSARKAEEEDIAIAKDLGKFTSGYCRSEFAGEVRHLQKALEQLKPTILVTLGATPFWALTGKSGVTSARGQLHENRLISGIPVLPTLHPSYILRGNWKMEPLFLADLKLAKEYALHE